MKGLTLDQNQYRLKVKELGKKWKSMTQDEKQPFHMQAAYEQDLRQQLSETPLATKAEGETKSDEGLKFLEEQVGRKALSKLSSRRLELNIKARKDHQLWDAPGQYGDSHLGNGQFKRRRPQTLHNIVLLLGFGSMLR